MRKFLVFLYFLIIAASAFAATWEPYFENKGGVTFFIDKQSVFILKNGHTKLWEKQVFSKPDKVFGVGLLYLFEVDCSERKFQQMAMKPLVLTPQSLKAVASLEGLYVGWQNFEPNELHEQRVKTWCGVK